MSFPSSLVAARFSNELGGFVQGKRGGGGESGGGKGARTR